MIDVAAFQNTQLHGGFLIARLEFTHGPIADALGREAAAETRVQGREFRLLIRAGLNDDELSVTLYHEILEAATVASWTAPLSVLDFNEGDFEQAARAWHAQWGVASPANVNRLLQFYGFQGE